MKTPIKVGIALSVENLEKILGVIKWVVVGLLLSVVVLISYGGSLAPDSPAAGIAGLLFFFFGIAVVLRLVYSRRCHLTVDSCNEQKKETFESILNKPKWILLAVVALIAFFVVSYRDVLWFPSVLVGTDVPIPGIVPIYHLIGLFSPWRPDSLGYYSSPGEIGGYVSAFFVIISRGDQILAQKFYFLCIPVASLTMFFLLQRYVSKNPLVSLFGSLVYAYSPVISGNFGSGVNWGFAFIPLVFVSLYEMLKPGRRLFYSAALAVALLLVYTWSPDFLALFPLAVAILLPLSLPQGMKVTRYLIDKFVCLLVFAALFFIFTYPSYAWDNLLFGGLQYSFSTLTTPPASQFIVNYSSFTHMRLLLGIEYFPIYLNSSLTGLTSICGLLVPSLALFSVLIKPRMFSKGDESFSYRQVILGSSILLLFLSSYVEFLHVANSNMVAFLVNLYKPLVFLRAPLTVLLVATFCYSVLATFSINSLTNYLGRLGKKELDHDFSRTRNPINKSQKWVTMLLVVLLVTSSLAIIFSFTPVFEPSFRDLSGGKFGYYANSPAYATAIKWFMSQPDFQSFRTVFLPTWPVALLNLPNSDPYTLTFSRAVNPYSTTFMSSLYNFIVDENSTYLGTFLALANVKYVAVTTGLNDSVRSYYLTGPPRAYGVVSSFPNFLIGDPEAFLQLMMEHKDFALVFQSNGLFIFQNLSYIPHISYYYSGLLFESNRSILDTLPLLPTPDKIVSRYALINYDQNLDSSLIGLSSAIIYDTPDISESALYMRIGYSRPIIAAFDTQSSQVTKSLVVDPITVIKNESNPVLEFGSGIVTTTPGKTPYWSVAGTTDQLGRLSIDIPTNPSLSASSNLVIPISLNSSRQLRSFSLYMIDANYCTAKWDLLAQLKGYASGWQNLTISSSNALTIGSNFNFSKVTTLRLEPIIASDSPLSYDVGIPLLLRGYASTFSLILPARSNVTLYLQSNQSLLSVLLDGVHIENTPSTVFGWNSYPTFELDGGNHSVTILASRSETVTIAIFTGTTLEKLLQAPTLVPINPRYVGPGQFDIDTPIPRNTFIVLGESFDSHWVAKSGQELALHARANDYANCFVLPGNGNATVSVQVEGLLNFELSVASRVGSFLVVLVVLILVFIRKRIQNLRKPTYQSGSNTFVGLKTYI